MPLDDEGLQGDDGQGQGVVDAAPKTSSTPKPALGAGAGDAGDHMDVEEGEEQRSRSPAAGETDEADAADKGGSRDKDKAAAERQQDQGVEEAKGGEKEKEKEKESEEDQEAAAAARRAEELAQKEAQAEAARKQEATKKAEAERKAVAAAETAAEKRVRRLRVSLVLNRLKEDAADRRKSGRLVPPQGRAAALQFHGAGSAAGGGGSAGKRKGGVITVPCLRDRDGKKEKKAREGADGGGSGPVESSGDAESLDWLPLGQRRLKRRLDCAAKHAVLARQPGGRRGLRLATMLQTDVRSEEVKAASGGGWLEARLARMRKSEDGEWAAWQERIGEEGTANPDEVAGPPLPFGFIPRLAHRALGAYALIRAFSKPFRLTPASSVAFLRALSLRLRTPLLDAIHCELLRRVFCLLKGRAGGWAKSTNAQRELDWKYLDQVRVCV